MVAIRGLRHIGAMHGGIDVKTVIYSTMLDYCDGPLLFEARDTIGGHYLAMAAELPERKDGYVVVGVAPDRLRQFRAGLIDLRLLVEEAGEDEWYLTEARDLTEPFALNRQQRPLSQSEFLPDEGYILHDTPSDAFVLKEAQTRNNLVLELVVEPPEAADNHRIRVETFVGLLDRVQKLVKHAYRMALRDLPRNHRPPVPPTDPTLLDVVVPAAAGSFRVVLEAAGRPDLFGGSELSRALQRVDVLFEHTTDTESALETARQNRGHLAGAYLNLLKFLTRRQTGMRYSWADPTFAQASSRAISEVEARQLADVLGDVSNLGTEEVTLVGEFVKFNRSTGAWGLLTDNGPVSGKLRDDSLSLNGLKVGGRYEFLCVEELVTVEGTGKETRNLNLREFNPA